MSELFLCEIEQRDKRSAAVTREYSRILDNSDMQIVIFTPSKFEAKNITPKMRILGNFMFATSSKIKEIQ